MANFVKVTFAGDATSLKRALGEAEASTNKMSKASGLLKNSLKLGAVAGFGALAVAAKIGFGELMEGQKVAAQTNAVLKSTGGVAKVSAKDVSSLATAIMRKSGIDDEAVASAQNLLLTFTKVRNEAGKGNDIFNQATGITADLSVALGTDLNSAAMQVGKALNDPIKGMTALGRAGVQFTADQKEAIKAMVESGDTMGAQKAILKELETQVGGSAEAFGKTLPGQINIAKETFNNLAGQGVGVAFTALSNLVAWIKLHWPEIKAAIVPTLISIRDTFVSIWSTFGPIVREHLKTVINVLKPLLMAIRDAVQLVMALLRGDWSQVWASLKGLAVNALRAAAEAVKGMVREFRTAIATLGGALLQELAKIPEGAYNVAIGIGKSIISGIKSGFGGLLGDLKNFFEGKLRGVLSDLNPFSPVEHGGEIHIGIPLMEGAIKGIEAGSDSLKAALEKSVRAAAESAKKSLDAAMAGLKKQITKIDLAQEAQQNKRTWEDLGIAVRDTQERLNSAQQSLAALGPNLSNFDPAEVLSLQRAVEDAQRAFTRANEDQQSFIQSRHRDDLQAALDRIPSHHTGGIVSGPRGTPRAIMALGGERVLPPGQSGSAGISITINALDPRGAAAAVRQALQESVRLNGPIPGIAS